MKTYGLMFPLRILYRRIYPYALPGINILSPNVISGKNFLSA